MAYNDEWPGAFSPGIDNEHWTYDSVPTISEDELLRRREEARRRHNAHTEWEMNHVDSTWGEKGCPRRIIVPPPTPDQISKRPIQPPAEFPDDRDINNYTVNDINPVYGLDSYNLRLLDTITARTSRVSAAIGYVNDTEQRLDLNKVIRMCPFLGKQLREILTEALTAEMKNNLEIITELNKYIYSQEPTPEPENPDENNEENGENTNETNGENQNQNEEQTDGVETTESTETPAEGTTETPTEGETQNSEVPVTPAG